MVKVNGMFQLIQLQLPSFPQLRGVNRNGYHGKTQIPLTAISSLAMISFITRNSKDPSKRWASGMYHIFNPQCVKPLRLPSHSRKRDCNNREHLLNLCPVPDIAPKLSIHYLISSTYQAYELDLTITVALQRKKLILRCVKQFFQAHSATRWQN